MRNEVTQTMSNSPGCLFSVIGSALLVIAIGLVLIPIMV